MIRMTVKTETSQWTRYELQIALLDGLFQTQKKTAHAELKLRQIDSYYDWHYQDKLYPKAIHLQLRAPYSLGVEEETVLLSLLYLAEQSGEFQPVTKLDDVPLLLEPDGMAQDKSVGVVWTTRYALLKIDHMDDSRYNYQRLNQYLKQLSQIWVYYHNSVSHWEGSDWFLRYRFNPQTDRLLVQINWRLAGAVFGPYLTAYVSLDERHQLKTQGGKTLHRWLSAHVWPGKTRTLRYETLLRHIWPENTTTSGTQRIRLHRLKTIIIPDLSKLSHWNLTTLSTKVSVSRQSEQQTLKTSVTS